MLRRQVLAAAVALMFGAGAAFAEDTLSGTIVHKDGSKVKKTAAITTSWNSARGTYPADGEYEIDFGGKVGKKITVYVNGDKYTEITVKGHTKLNIKLKK
jgi:hypothetical protein